MPFYQNLTGEFIAPSGGSWEPQRTNNWSLVIDLAHLGLETIGAGDGSGGSGSVTLQMAIQSATAPTFTLDKSEISWMNEKRKVASVPSFDGGSFTFVDYLDQPVVFILYEWYKKGYNPETGQVGLARDYKTRGTLVLLRPDGWPGGGPGYNTPRQIQLQGLWISSFNPATSLDYTSPDISKVEVTFEWDKALLTGASLEEINVNRFKFTQPNSGETSWMIPDVNLNQQIG